jgi:hypothetical protein
VHIHEISWDFGQCYVISRVNLKFFFFNIVPAVSLKEAFAMAKALADAKKGAEAVYATTTKLAKIATRIFSSLVTPPTAAQSDSEMAASSSIPPADHPNQPEYQEWLEYINTVLSCAALLLFAGIVIFWLIRGLKKRQNRQAKLEAERLREMILKQELRNELRHQLNLEMTSQSAPFNVDLQLDHAAASTSANKRKCGSKSIFINRAILIINLNFFL